MKTLDTVYKSIIHKQEVLAVLLDPDKLELSNIESILSKIPEDTNLILIGGSAIKDHKTDYFVKGLKKYINKPLILFPGDTNQITPQADAILYLSLLSGNNPEFLIHQQVKAVQKLKNTKLEIIPTGYILIDGGKVSAVERVSKTKPIAQHQIEKIVDTAIAGEYLGKKIIYLEAGSGALYPVHPNIIKAVKKNISIPLFVGGGIRNEKQKKAAYTAGADVVVMGTAFE